MISDSRIYLHNDFNEDYIAVFNGTVEIDGDKITVKYPEDETTDVSLFATGNIVMLSRVGELTYSLILEKDSPKTMTAISKYGKLELMVVPKDVSIVQNDKEIFITLEYSVGVEDVMDDKKVCLKCDIS